MRVIFLLLSAGFFLMACNGKKQASETAQQEGKTSEAQAQGKKALDTVVYNQLLQHMSNSDTLGQWPVKHAYPMAGAILPFNRIIAYYGNLYSKQMGILGELPKEAMFMRLKEEVNKWSSADPKMPAIPALHYIAVTAQKAPGSGGTHRMRMPFDQIDTVLNWAKEINALVFIDIQIGLSTLQAEVPEFKQYLAMPQVHFGIDPEFSMKKGNRPGSAIGSFDATDINYVTEYLAGLVQKHQLPPKVLILHRFTQGMITNYKNITLRPEVQIVVDMDGWGGPEKKINTYEQYIYSEPVQFAGFKIFYKNDAKGGNRNIMQPEDLLKLTPRPVYIQYQ